ncbi:nucleotidyltransferase domain-containing protein [Thioalkalivibrio denitrificans]|nr:nucleotidyltransferase domain-containing protein [Thioalkalivibrio denitrificans]
MKPSTESGWKDNDAARNLRVQVARAREVRQQRLVEALRERVRAALNASPPIAARVYLFGSWATGNFDGESDVDLLIIATDESDVREAQRRLMEVGDDVLAFSRQDWERRVSGNSPFVERLVSERLLLVETGREAV